MRTKLYGPALFISVMLIVNAGVQAGCWCASGEPIYLAIAGVSFVGGLVALIWTRKKD